MKKILIVAGLLVSLATGIFAQDFRTWGSFHDAHQNRGSFLDRALDKLFFSSASKPNWIKEIEKQVRYVTPNDGRLVGPIITDFVPAQPNAPISADQHQAVNGANQAWQEALNKNKNPINRFRIKTPRPQDVAALSQTEVQNVSALLSGDLTTDKVDVFKHYMVRVTLIGSQPIHVLFNCYLREMYIVRGNAHLPGVPLER